MKKRYLVVDTSSATSTLALGEPGSPEATRALPQRQTSESLLPTIDELLDEVGVPFSDLSGLVAIHGPGSFTGLRIGLATLYGLHQATGVAATTVSTLEALGGLSDVCDEVALSVVDALRGEWFAQTFHEGRAVAPLAAPQILHFDALKAMEIGTWIGFSEPPSWSEGSASEFLAPANLAAELLTRFDPERATWDPSALLHPLYLRAPAVTLPKAKGPRSIR